MIFIFLFFFKKSVHLIYINNQIKFNLNFIEKIALQLQMN